MRTTEGDFAGIAQLVECKLPKLDVAGSNPVARFAEKQNQQKKY